MKFLTPSKKVIEAIQATTDNTFKKDIRMTIRMTIRLYDHDYNGIQKQAMEMGISYQMRISSIIHRSIEGGLSITIGWQRSAYTFPKQEAS